MSQSGPVILIGASVRALAFSALRAGMKPWCADLFADADLRLRCPVVALPRKDYPEGFARLLKKAPPGPIIYTGGLENDPELLNRLARTRTIWGIQGGALERVRRPEDLAAILKQAGLPFPRLQTDPGQLAEDCRWLAKPRQGTAGHGIHFVVAPGLTPSLAERNLSVPAALPRPGWYFQEFIPGQPQSALFAGLSGSAFLLGVTRQLVGESWLHAAPFQYCGSIGPLQITKTAWRHYHAIGQALVAEFRLEGLFGVDLILRGHMPFPVEVNPRWTASAEVLDYARGVSLLKYHLVPFRGGAAGDERHQMPAGLVGKAILYAPRPFIFPEDGPWRGELEEPRDLWELPDYADIPSPGQHFHRAQPVLTVFARGKTVEHCLAALQKRAAQVYEEIERRSRA